MSQIAFIGSPGLAHTGSPGMVRNQDQAGRSFWVGVDLIGTPRTFLDIRNNRDYFQRVSDILDTLPFPTEPQSGATITVHTWGLVNDGVDGSTGRPINLRAVFSNSNNNDNVGDSFYYGQPPGNLTAPFNEFAYLRAKSEFACSPFAGTLTIAGAVMRKRAMSLGATKFPACISIDNGDGVWNCEAPRLTVPGSGGLWSHSGTAVTLKSPPYPETVTQAFSLVRQTKVTLRRVINGGVDVTPPCCLI